MKIVFMGTPEFAVPSLERLIKEFGVKAVFTQPDRPKGRGKKLSMSPIKEVALRENIKILQPQKLRDDREAIEFLRKLSPDFIIVVAYGQILSKEILDIPKYGCINLHASLLPKYRGAAPINWAIINGEKFSGNTTMFMDVGLDTGDMLLKDEFKIEDNTTAGELHNKLMESGGELLVKTINGLVEDSIEPEKQKDEESCYASMLDKKMAKINWNLESEDIKNLIRGLNPWPLAYTYYKGTMMKIYEAEIIDKKEDFLPGFIIDVSKEGIKVATKDGILLLKKIQFPSKKPMYIEEYIRGNEIEKGIILE
ncbi:methionyl-tRNA formyltransferase [Clostridium tetani]|uniref:Methionyl-tRNA formyltransferase n=1 Tax=Clostridium tetani TaxID=1513 RepID=A0ABY0EL13_CLOTA|nr:methionyl-tRNA formyltransferase [Clostridium tetani]CDI49310.1 methionyl-tRNA formyltransferase [Clostridium tetani 12124569]KHO39314.1 methionyl-tRNA formyltransferase [Clostridium tetani]RXI37835.1 methionyl-tRNA formyltransferase [Clostridium tetani]RXI51832.1 methionyl-tRNA formyltransferase [Clostridium tetani]RXI73943.1 methionyl-tRNA formyltransferase [Clostridium tetani]